MFIVFFDTGSHIFQSDPNNNSDSTAYSDTNLNRIRIAAVGSDLFQVGSQRNRARFKVIGSELFWSGPIENWTHLVGANRIWARIVSHRARLPIGGGRGGGEGGVDLLGWGGGQCFPRKTSLLFVQAKINLGLGEGGGGVWGKWYFPHENVLKTKDPLCLKNVSNKYLYAFNWRFVFYGYSDFFKLNLMAVVRIYHMYT